MFLSRPVPSRSVPHSRHSVIPLIPSPLQHFFISVVLSRSRFHSHSFDRSFKCIRHLISSHKYLSAQQINCAELSLFRSFHFTIAHTKRLASPLSLSSLSLSLTFSSTHLTPSAHGPRQSGTACMQQNSTPFILSRY